MGAQLPPFVPAPKVQVVGTRTGIAGLGVPSTIGHKRGNQRSQHFFPYGANEIQLMFPGWQKTNALGTYRGESVVNPSIYYCKRVTVASGGTLYGVGDMLVFNTWGNGLTPLVVMIDAVSSGVITSAHVVRAGVYKTPIADGSSHMAIWQKGFGYGAYNEITYSGGTLTVGGYLPSAGNGGINYVSANTFLSIASGPTAAGGTLTAQIDPNLGAITAITVGGTWTVTTTNDSNAVVAISSGVSGTLGSGATFNFEWDTAAYMVRASVDPQYLVTTSSGQVTGASAHRTVYCTSGHPENTGQDVFGNTKDIYVPVGANIWTDTVTVDIAAGTSAGLRLMYFGDAALGRQSVLAGENRFVDFTNFDMTQGGNFGTTYVTSVGLVQPVVIMGVPKKAGPSLLIFGDSREQGVDSLAGSPTGFDVYDIVNGSCGWIERAVGNTVPWTNFSRSGEALYNVTRNRHMQYDALRKMSKAGTFPECVYINLSVNDFCALTQTAANVALWEAQLVADMRGFGAKFVFTDTTPPESTSTQTTFTGLWASIVAGGSGYPANSIVALTVAGGTFSQAMIVNAITDSAGVVRGIDSISNIGAYTVKPTQGSTQATTTGGTGTGCTMIPYFTNYINTTQSAKTGNSEIQIRNAALRAGTPGNQYAGYDDYIDWGTIVETTIGSGLWPPGSVGDGVHPAPNTMITMAAFAKPKIASYLARSFRNN